MTIDELIGSLSFDANGLIPAIAQQHDSGEILMVAWMNEDAVRATLTDGMVCYFSRSRDTLWRKGESSGQTQRLVDFRIDCDQDTILLQVDQHGVACHTGRSNCFYRAYRAGTLETIADIKVSPDQLYNK